MFIQLPLLLASAALISGADTVKKKPAADSAPAPRSVDIASSTVSKGRPQPDASPAAGKSAPKQSLLGAAIGKSLAGAVRAAAPRAAFLGNAIRARASRGPALPPNIKGDPNAIEIYADSIVVEKSRRTMTLYSQGTPVRIYFIALGSNPVGKKVGLGDNRTPEGLYYIEGHNPGSKYHLSLRVSYPNAQDVAEARARGTSTGGDIMIHGLPKGFEKVGAEHRQRDWTNGCIAVTNAEIEEIWTAIPDGAAIQIKP